MNRPSDCHSRAGEVASGLIHSVEPLSSLTSGLIHSLFSLPPQSLKLFPFSSLANVLLPSPFTLPIFLSTSAFLSYFSLPVSPPSIPPPSPSLFMLPHPPFSTPTTHSLHLPSMLPHSLPLLHTHPPFTPSFPSSSARRAQWVGRWRWEELRALKLRYDLVHVVNEDLDLLPFSPEALNLLYVLFHSTMKYYTHVDTNTHAHNDTHFSSIWLASKKYLEVFCFPFHSIHFHYSLYTLTYCY